MTVEKTTSLHIVDDDALVRNSLAAVLRNASYNVSVHSSGVDFLKALPSLNPRCVILDVRMPKMSGLDVLEVLKQDHPMIPVIMISGFADVAMAVKAMQSGASDFVEKPFNANDVLDTLKRVLDTSPSSNAKTDTNAETDTLFDTLSKREVDVLSLLVQGKQNKVVAHELGISPRTVEVHRARIMQRLEVASFAELVRISVQSGLKID
jgi:two-component system response regulator FixJ